MQGFLNALADNEPDEALEILLRTTPFPAICGRACPAPCMQLCNRIEIDGAVNVRQLERYAGDHGKVQPKRQDDRPERIAIVGSGPAGLTAAYHLARFGYRVRVHESGNEIGGLLKTGIPQFRLPEDVVDREIGRILEQSEKLMLEHRPEKLLILGDTNSGLAAFVAKVRIEVVHEEPVEDSETAA